MKNRKIFLFVILALLLLSTGWMVYRIHCKLEQKTLIENNIQQFPSIFFYTMDNRRIHSENFRTGKPILLLYFSTECSYCNFELDQIIEYVPQLADITILLISSEKITRLKYLSRRKHLDAYPMISLLKVDRQEFREVFGRVPVPTIFIYKNNCLVKKYKGSTKMATILKKLQNNCPDEKDI